MDKKFITRIHDETPTMYIGKVVELTGATRKAVRHYEEIGLIPKPARKGQYRVYSERDVFLVHMIKTAQSVGFSLDELRGLVELKVTEKNFPLEFAKALFREKRHRLHAEIKSLQQQVTHLDLLYEDMLEHFN